jgi:hypothetical protein
VRLLFLYRLKVPCLSAWLALLNPGAAFGAATEALLVSPEGEGTCWTAGDPAFIMHLRRNP